MQTIVVMLAAAQLPPPPEPEAVTNGNAVLPILLVSGGLALIAVLAVLGALLRRRAAGRKRERTLPGSTYRIEHWRDGTATTLGHSNNPAARDELLATHAARLRAQGATGSLVWIEQVSDALVAIKPLQAEAPGVAGSASASPPAQGGRSSSRSR